MPSLSYWTNIVLKNILTSADIDADAYIFHISIVNKKIASVIKDIFVDIFF